VVNKHELHNLHHLPNLALVIN